MADDVLFRVTTPALVCEITGPRTHRHLANTKSPNAYFDVAANHDGMAVTVAAPHEKHTPWSTGDDGPAFYEDVTYRFFARSLQANLPVTVNHRDRSLLADLDRRPKDGLVTGTINFRRQIGRSELHLAVGTDTVTVTVEVLPTKLDYRADYDALLDGVRTANQSLVLEYLRSTYRLAVRERRQAGDVEWMTLLRERMDGLERALQTIDHRPARVLRPILSSRRSERIRRIDATAMHAIRRGGGSGAWQTTPDGLHMREKVPSRTPTESLDTPEHRWIAQELRTIALRLEKYERAFAAPGRHAETTDRTRQLLDEFHDLGRRVNNLVHIPALNTRGTVPAGFASLQLTGALGYADAYRNLTEIRHALSLDPGIEHVSISDLHELYEIWCFLEIVQLLTQLTNGSIDAAEAIRTRNGRLGVALVKGQGSRVRLHSSSFDLAVEYNPRFPGLSGDQIPDILIRVIRNGRPDVLLTLDAKYRLDSSGDYQRQFGTVGPPREALNALHRYRDAITDNPTSYSRRPVTRGLALFPLSQSRSAAFPQSRLRRSLDVQGIGALPFLPGNTDHVRDWLTEILSLPPDVLALSGPPYPLSPVLDVFIP